MKKIISVAFSLFAATAMAAKPVEVKIIPQPTSVTLEKGKGLQVVARGLDEAVAQTMQSAAVVIDPEMGREEYDMRVSRAGVSVTAGSDAGVFYAQQTLKQLMVSNAEFKTVNSERSAVFTVPAIAISDKPAFGYRGAMLDVSRHFADKEDVKRFLDMMAIHKLNVFHWHLTDDQGWRIQIKSHPELTDKGSVRSGTLIGHGGNPPFQYDGKPYGGCYSQEDAKEVIAYAAKLHITVIPEIELPGHAEAALAAIPEIGCTGGPYEVWRRWGVNDEVFCAGNDKTFEVLEDVLAEIIELFPSDIIHIGGDECPKTRWKACPKCQARMKAEGLKDEHELQSYFIQRIEKFVMSKGKNIIGWDEILEGGLSKTATVMSWRGSDGGITAAKAGNYVVMSPNTHCYLDYYQAKPESEEPYGIGGYLPLEKVYQLDPLAGIPAEYHKFVLGVQGNLWREYVKTMPHTFYMMLPRLAAIAERGWSYDNNITFADFVDRLPTLRLLYDVYGFKYADRDDQPLAAK